MKLKQLYWDEYDPNRPTAQFLGLTLSVYRNNGKWEARLTTPHQRPEIQQGFSSIEEAMRYAEHVLLARELKKYLTFADE